MEFLNFEGLAYFKNKENSQIAPVESTTTASQAYEIGQYFWYEGKLYEATAAIALGDTFVTSGDSANCELADIADDISDARERISTLEGQVTDLETNKANIDGYYSEMTVGNAEQIVSTVGVEDKTPYNFRTAGGSVDIGDREEDMVVGGTIAWNQLVTTDTNVSKTKSGDIITVNDAVAGNAEDLVVSFEPQQDLHGYDNPWPGGGGDNKLPLIGYQGCGYNASTGAQFDMTVLNDTTTTINSISRSLPGWGRLCMISEYLDSGTYYFHVEMATASIAYTLYVLDEDKKVSRNLERSNNSQTSLTANKAITLSGSEHYIALYFSNTSGTATATVTNPYVISGSSPSTYKPYSNICPITGWTGCEATRAGKNVFDGVFQQGTFTNEGLESATNTRIRSNFIPVSEGTIAISTPTANALIHEAYAYNSSKTFVRKIGFSPAAESQVSTIQSGESFIRFSVRYTDNSVITPNDNVKAQVEFNQTATDYESYSGTTISVSWQSEAGTVYGGTHEFVSGGLTSKMASVDLGALTWGWSSVGKFYSTELTAAKAPSSNTDIANMVCSIYTADSDAHSNSAIYNNIITLSSTSLLCVRDSRFTDAASFKAAMSGVQLVYELATPIEYTLTAQQIALLAGTNNLWNSIGSTQMTYLGTLNEITAQSGHKYLTRVNGSSTVVNGSGQTLSGEKGRDNIFDLTQMFGSAIADYVYSLENTSAGEGVTWFTDLFPKPYYSYNAGQLMSVNTSAHKTVGFNAWDEQWEKGSYDTTTGNKTTGLQTQIRSKNYIPVIPEMGYYINTPTADYMWFFFYDADKTLITTGLPTNYNQSASNARAFARKVVTMPANCHYINFYTQSNYGGTYKGDICINLSWDGERDGEYEPYEEHVYPLDSSLTLRGVPKFDSGNNLYYDGDTYESDGTVTRKYGIVDLGTLSWSKTGTKAFYTLNTLNPAMKVSVSDGANMVCGKYVFSGGAGTSTTYKDNCICYDWNNLGKIIIFDSSLSGYSATQFATAMSGVYLVYELATPTTEEAGPYQNPQVVDDFGTEEYVDYAVLNNEREVSIPVGHVTMYQANLRAKLEMAPQSPDGDGDYIVRQSNGENEYVPLVIPQELPESPTSNGTYILQATVSGGTTTLAWVSAT